MSSRFNSGRGHHCDRDGFRSAVIRQVGSKRERKLTVNASGALLAEGARFSEAISRLSQTTFVPKGIYRFRSHEAANRHAEDCLVRGMGRLAATRLKNE
jgi:hypothetical protein